MVLKTLINSRYGSSRNLNKSMKSQTEDDTQTMDQCSTDQSVPHHPMHSLTNKKCDKNDPNGLNDQNETKKNPKRINAAVRLITSIHQMLKLCDQEPIDDSFPKQHQQDQEISRRNVAERSTKPIFLDNETEQTAKTLDCQSSEDMNDVASMESSDEDDYTYTDYYDYDSDIFTDSLLDTLDMESALDSALESDFDWDDDATATTTATEKEQVKGHDDVAPSRVQLQGDHVTRPQNPMQELVEEVNEALAKYHDEEMKLNEALTIHLAHARARYEAKNEMGAILSMRRVRILRHQHAKLVEVIQYLGAQEVQLVMKIIASNRGQQEASCPQNVKEEVDRIFAKGGDQGRLDDKALLQELADLFAGKKRQLSSSSSQQ